MTGTQRNGAGRRNYDEWFETPKEEVDACLRCKLPDCMPTSKSCELRKLLEEKRGRKVKM